MSAVALSKIEANVNSMKGKWYELQDKNLAEITPHLATSRPETVHGGPMETKSNPSSRRVEQELGKTRAREGRTTTRLSLQKDTIGKLSQM